MKLTVLGIAIGGYGTYLTFIDKWRVAGVVLIALGTLLIAIAQRRDSTADVRRIEATFQQKIAEVHRDISAAKALPTGSQATKKLDQIDHAFSDWAASFVQNRERRKLEIEQTRVADLQTQLDKSEIWRPVLELFLRTVSGAARAYSLETGSSITAHLPKLPPNLYDRAARYNGRVVFSKTVNWRIELDTDTGFLGEFPAAVVTLVRGDDDDLLLRIWSVSRDKDFVRVSFISDVLPKLSGIDGGLSKANYQQELPKAIMRLFEAQILALDSNAHGR
jgi:hypothetical protein